MTIRTDRGIGSFRCQRRNCTNTTQQAIVRGTWFEGVETKLMIAKGLLLMYSFATGLSYEQAIRETTIVSAKEITSLATVSDWYRYI